MITVKKYVPKSKNKVDMQIKFEVCFFAPCELNWDVDTRFFQVCCLDKVELTGIRLSRVKGDTWAYKKETDALLDKMKL